MIVCAALVELSSWLANTSDAGVRAACGAGGTVPVPLSAADCGEPEALSVTVIAAASAPANCGVKVTETMQLALAASAVPQVLVWLNALALTPVMAMLLTVSAAVPGLESVIVCAAEVVPVF